MADVFAYLEGFGTGGGEGGTLKVNAPPMVAVTITNKAGKTKTKTANADGMAIFKGLASGKWNVTIVNSDGKPTTITLQSLFSPLPSTSLIQLVRHVHVQMASRRLQPLTPAVHGLASYRTPGLGRRPPQVGRRPTARLSLLPRMVRTPLWS